MRNLGTLAFVLGALLLSACRAIAPPPSEASPVRIIVRFTPDVVAPQAPELAAKLSRLAGTPLEYVHPLSGGAHLIIARGISDGRQLAELLARLTAQAEVEYAETDSRLLQAPHTP